tara:strand:- start:326 stop:1036 length:711 start_codon:yes stop_codon:yes gene_type:complete
MITLVIHQNATKYFKNEKELKVEVKDYYSLISFLVNSFPKFAEFVKQNKNKLNTDFFILNEDKKRIDLADVQANKKLKDEVYYLVPSILGGGGKGGGIAMVVIGIALIAVAFYLAPAVVGPMGPTLGMGTTAFSIGSVGISFTQIAMFGASLALQGIMAIVQSQPNAKSSTRTFVDDGSRTENSLFTGLTNTVNSNIPVGMRYGLTRIGGHLVTGYVKTFNHGKSDVISVSENFAA